MISLTKYQMLDAELSQIEGEDRQFQCRQVSDADVKAMAETLKKEKQKVPIYLLRRRNGKLQILCGFTRYLAAKLLGWATIVAIIIPEEDFENENEIYKFGVIENGKRKPLSNADKGNICKSMSARGMNNVEIGECLGISEKQVRRYLKIANAPAEVQKGMSDNSVPLRAIDNIDPATGQLGTRAEQIVDNPNSRVKSVKNGFDATLKFRLGRDGADLIKKFKANIDEAFKEAQKPQPVSRASHGGLDPAAVKAAKATLKADKIEADGIEAEIKLGQAAVKNAEKGKLDSSAMKQQLQEKIDKLKALKLKIKEAEKFLKPASAKPKKPTIQQAPGRSSQPQVSSQSNVSSPSNMSSRPQGEILPLGNNSAVGFDLIELKLSFDPSKPPAEKLTEISLTLNESKPIYATAQVMGNPVPLDKSNKEIKWHGDGVEVTPNWGPEVTIKLPAPLAQPGKLTVSCRMPNGKDIEASAVVKQS